MFIKEVFGQQAVNVERVLDSNKELEVRFSDDFPSLPNHYFIIKKFFLKASFLQRSNLCFVPTRNK